MANEKSPRPRSSPSEISSALKRAVKALRGTSKKLTRRAIAIRASSYVPESAKKLFNVLDAMNDEEFAALLSSQSVAGTAYPPLLARATRPGRSGSWVAYKKRCP